MKKLFQNKLYIVSWTADLVSDFGDSMFYLALVNYIIQLPQYEATFAISIVTLSESLPMLFPIFTGFLADKTRYIIKAIFSTLFIRTLLYLLVGLLFGLSPALWIIGAVTIINFISDLLGHYESGLYIPISMILVKNDDREEVMSVRSSITQTLRIGFQAIGSFLIVIMSYQALAFLNAATFLISAIILTTIMQPLKQLLTQHQSTIEKTKHSVHQKLSFTAQLKYIIKQLKHYPILWHNMIVLFFFNGAGSGIQAFIMKYMTQSTDFIIFTPALTITILSTLFAIAGILGGLLNIVLKKVNAQQLLIVGIIGIFGIHASLLAHNMILAYIFLFITGTSSSMYSPKFSAMVLNTLPQDVLATTIGIISTILTFSVIIMTSILSLLLPFVAIELLSIAMLTLSVLIAFYVIFMLKNDTIAPLKN